MKVGTPEQILDQLEGATIVSWDCSDEEGMHLVFQDGRVLVIAGMFALSVLQMGSERLH